MGLEVYIDELSMVVAQMSEQIADVSISGEGSGSFVVANNNDYGIEIYRDKKNSVIIDPALKGELLGEREYPNYGEAIESALRWLKEGKLE